MTIGCALLAAFIVAPSARAAVLAKEKSPRTACSLLSAEDAALALGQPVGAGRQEPDPTPGVKGTRCHFQAVQDALSAVSLTLQHSSGDVRDAMSGMPDDLKAAGMQDVRVVTGIGDGAIWARMNLLGGVMGSLVVRKGRSVLLTIILNGPLDEVTALDHAKFLAMKVLPEL